MTTRTSAIIPAMRAVDSARIAYIAAGYHGTDEYVDALEQLFITVRDTRAVELAHERASGYAAAFEDASGTETVPAPGSWRGDSGGWLDFADAYAQAKADYDSGRRGSMTNCKAAYGRWTETGGRTIDDEMDERAAAIRAARTAGARRSWTDTDIPDDALNRVTDGE